MGGGGGRGLPSDRWQSRRKALHLPEGQAQPRLALEEGVVLLVHLVRVRAEVRVGVGVNIRVRVRVRVGTGPRVFGTQCALLST